jgi:hydrogenase-4 component B
VALSGVAAVPWVLGLFPSVFFSGAARLSAGFFQVETEPVRFFTAEALAGAAVPLGIGLVIYWLVVRGPLSEKTEGGRVYIDRKPAWLDLEDRVYRPLMKALVSAVSVCFWAIASLPEWLIAAGRRGLLHVRAWRVPMPGGNRFTCAVGGFLNGVVAILNKTVRRNRPFGIDFSCALAAGNEEINRSMRRLKRSMSYSLLLFCVGLFLLLGYLMIW